MPETQETYPALKDNGVQSRKDLHVIANTGSYAMWMAVFMDTEGNTLAMMSEVPNPKS